MQPACRICGNDKSNHIVTVMEMMFGTHEKFDYVECSNCGCLQIAEIPKNIPKYYASQYFSDKRHRQEVRIKDLAKLTMLKLNRFLPRQILTRYMVSVFELPFILNLMSNFQVKLESRILEIGCGRGGLLMTLLDVGFKNVVGLEPFAQGKVRDDLTIINSTIEEFCPQTEFDVVIFNHSLEHIPNQLSAFRRTSAILSKTGVCQVRIPVKTDYVWQHFGINWVQLDAPRHFYLHTVKSLSALGAKAGLSVRSSVFDSTGFQFWGTEQYRQNIPLRAENSYWVNPRKSVFSQDEIRRFSRMARKLNQICQGDQATFFVTKQDMPAR